MKEEKWEIHYSFRAIYSENLQAGSISLFSLFYRFFLAKVYKFEFARY